MANFVVVIDPDMVRRARFIEDIKPLLSPVDNLETNICSTGRFCCIWAMEARAPVSYAADDKGASVIWGDAIGETKFNRIDAVKLRELWGDTHRRSKSVFDGFYAGVLYQPESGLVAGADILGIFPVYYWTRGEILLMGSSPELFKYHPAFRIKFNPSGLVGILLTMHIFDGYTLLEGVRRLAAGHLISWRSNKAPVEVVQYKVGVSEKYFSLPFSAHVEILDQAVEKTIARHVPANGDYSLLLSGGLDSRMLAGYLSKKGIYPEALTLGKRSDLEMENAIPVARSLGLRHHLLDITFSEYPFCASLQTRWEHIVNGFNSIMNWGIYPYLRNFGRRVIMGHTFDAVIGSNCITWPYLPSDGTMSFESYFAMLNGWGISPQILKRLLRSEVFGDLVDETIARIKRVYESYSAFESQRAWCFNLYHRQRFHVGGAAWALSFGAWPVMPSLDRGLLESAGAMPASTIAERRAQVELLCKRFPKLAALPLDRNSYNTAPLQPRLRYQVARYIYNHLRPLNRLRHIGRNSDGERRYYYRIYDFNSPGWTTVRRQAEPCRERLLGLFHQDVLAALLPAPEVPLHFENGIIEASGLKSLLGFMLWSKNYL